MLNLVAKSLNKKQKYLCSLQYLPTRHSMTVKGKMVPPQWRGWAVPPPRQEAPPTPSLREDAWRRTNYLGGIPAPLNAQPQSDHEETSDKLKLRKMLQNKWPVLFKCQGHK